MFGARRKQVMQKNFLSRLILFAGFLLIFQTGIHAQSSGDSSATVGRIICIFPKEPKDILKIQQASRTARVNAAENMLIRRGYVLFLKPEGRAWVICGDGKKYELKPGAHGCPCTQTCGPEICGISNGSIIGPTRGPDTNLGTFPVVISPRRTVLRNLRPTIRWTPIAGANKNTVYQVTLYGDNMSPLWTQDVVYETWLTYPDKVPPLRSGQTYKVVVTCEGSNSQQDPSPGLGFTILTETEAQKLAAEESKRKQLGISETQTRFLVTNLYAARGLYSEAIEELEDLYTIMKQPEVVMTLGDLYATVGLNREAEKKYQEALALMPVRDLYGLAMTHKNLAQVYENLGLFEKAIVQLQEARKNYRRLGNIAMVRALFRKEQRLKKSQDPRMEQKPKKQKLKKLQYHPKKQNKQQRLKKLQSHR
jgi:hypothetical protein